jgi:hypothetical protein
MCQSLDRSPIASLKRSSSSQESSKADLTEEKTNTGEELKQLSTVMLQLDSDLGLIFFSYSVSSPHSILHTERSLDP